VDDGEHEHFETDEEGLGLLAPFVCTFVITVLFFAFEDCGGYETDDDSLPECHEYNTLDAQEFTEWVAPSQISLDDVVESYKTGKGKEDGYVDHHEGVCSWG